MRQAAQDAGVSYFEHILVCTNFIVEATVQTLPVRNSAHNIHDSTNIRLIKFTVSEWCRKWPLDGAGFDIHKTSKIPPSSFTAPVQDISHFMFLLFT